MWEGREPPSNLAPSFNAVPSQAVIRELDGLKRNPLLGYQAREAVGVLERAQEGGSGHSRSSGSSSSKRPPLLRLQGEDEVGSQGRLLTMRSAEGRGGEGGIGRQKEVGSEDGLLMRSAEGDGAIIIPSRAS